MKLKKSPVLIVAHRGASGIAPENTLGAIAKAMEIGADYSEVDVHLSKDGHPVLLHDETLLRTIKVNGLVTDFTQAELGKLDAGSWYSPAYASERIPTLQEVINKVRKKMFLNIEIKASYRNREIANRVVDLVESEDFIDQCIVTSFDRQILETISGLHSDIRTGFIFEQIDETVFFGTWQVLSCHHRLVDKYFVDKARAAGKEIHAWTVNHLGRMRELIHLGVDAIITDHPDRLKKVLQMI